MKGRIWFKTPLHKAQEAFQDAFKEILFFWNILQPPWRIWCINDSDEDALRHKMHFLLFLSLSLVVFMILKWCLSLFFVTPIPSLWWIGIFVWKKDLVLLLLFRLLEMRQNTHLVICDIILSSVLFIALLTTWPISYFNFYYNSQYWLCFEFSDHS